MGWPSLVRDVKGLRARTRYPIETGSMVIPVGTEGTIEDSTAWHRLRFRTAPCGCCGVQMRVNASRGAFEPIR